MPTLTSQTWRSGHDATIENHLLHALTCEASAAVLPLKPFTVADLIDDTAFDVVVLGAGGAGMATALFAAIEGARVLLIESTAQVGGSTALSAGIAWVPGTRQGLAMNPDDTLDAARMYLDRAIGGRTPAALRQAFLAHGAKAIRILEKESHVRFRARRSRRDHFKALEGAARTGRALVPLPFDGRRLGPDFDLLRAPIAESMVLGGMMATRQDVAHLQQARRSIPSLRHAVRLVGRLVRDRLKHRRGTHLLRGNALVGQLLLSLRERGVTMLMRTRATSITTGPDGVSDVMLMQDSATRRVRVLGGVVLATGGFNRSPMQRSARLPGIEMAWCPGAPGHTGTAHTLAESLGAVYGTGAMTECFWAPVSLRTRPDGTSVAIPHFSIDRGSPRMVAVDANGFRFLNEALPHHGFAIEMQEAQAIAPTIPTYLITDAEGMARYGLGMVRPQGWGLKAALAEGYLFSAPTLRELATKLEIRAAPLTDSVSQFNSQWHAGHEAADGTPSPGPHRADDERNAADAEIDWQARSTMVGPIHKAPFYAIKLYPGDLGAVTGFATDAHARVLNRQGTPIGGLYAVGGDMHSVMGGVDPAPGCSLGPALVFGSLAARDAVARAQRPPQLRRSG